jgi:hypothetical protein
MYSLIDVTRLLEVDDHPDMWEAVPALPSRLCNYCPYLRRGAPADDTGCPGDTEADATAIAKFADGIIVRSGAS